MRAKCAIFLRDWPQLVIALSEVRPVFTGDEPHDAGEIGTSKQDCVDVTACEAADEIPDQGLKVGHDIAITVRRLALDMKLPFRHRRSMSPSA
jgi:hypothetical protein